MKRLKLILFTMLLICCFFQSALAEESGETLKSVSYFPVGINGKWGFIDRFGKIVIKPAFDWADEFIGGLAVVRRNGKWGYIDQQGKIVVEPVLDSAMAFENEIALVKISHGPRKSQYGVISSSGQLLLKEEFTDMQQTGRVFFVQEKQGGDYAIMLLNGKVITPYYYKSRNALLSVVHDEDERNEREFIVGAPIIIDEIFFSEGLIEYVENGLYGYVNDKGDVVIPAKFEFGYPFNNGEAVVKYSGRWGIIDKKGAFVIAPKYERLQKKGFSEGLCGVRVGGKWGFIDRKEQLVIKPQFWRVETFSDGAAIYAVNTKRSNNYIKYGYIDRTGKPFIKATMVYAEPYRNGLAMVTRTASEGSDPYIIDKKNHEVFWAKFKGMVQSMDDNYVLLNRDENGYLLLDRKSLKPVVEVNPPIRFVGYPQNGIMSFCIESSKDSATYGYMNVAGETIFRHTETGKENVRKLASFCH